MTIETAQTLIVPIVAETDAFIPAYARPGDAGFDLLARIEIPVQLFPGHRMAIPVGIQVAIPDGYEIQIRSRSGLALNHGVIVLNAPGTIDSGFRGEIKVILVNTDNHKPFMIEPMMRIGQGILAPIVKARFVPVSELDDTHRGDGGFGSTGKFK